MNDKLTVVYSEARQGESSRPRLLEDLAAAVSPWTNVEVAIVPHLYDLAPEGPGVEYLASIQGDMVVLCHLYPRAAFWLLDSHEIRGRQGQTAFCPKDDSDPDGSTEPSQDSLQRTIWCIDLRDHVEAEPLLDELARIASESLGQPSSEIVAEAGATNGTTRIDEITQARWYPIVDRNRCEGCLECLNFCLFGVFGTDTSENLFVEQPDACRDGCPACARVCPGGAIMFPHFNNPAIAGDPKASPDERNVTLVDLFQSAGLGDSSPDSAAQAERDKALREQTEAQQKPADDLDRLVDDLDEIDL